MKKISIVIPCYNEEANIPELYQKVINVIQKELSMYDYELLFIDNKSRDNSRKLIRDLCTRDSHVKAIFNRINCGPNTNPFFGLRESDGDCAILLYADFQEPVELIPVMVRSWEQGNKVVCMVKDRSEENHFVYFCREMYYRIFKSMSSVAQIRQFTGFGLYDKTFIDVLRTLHDATPFLKGIVAEYAPDHIEIPYTQQKRKRGHSSLNFMGYYDSAMLSFTSYTKGGLRVASFFGFFVAITSFVIAIFYLIRKLMYWDSFAAGNIPILLCVLFFGGCQLLFTGLLGEYVMSINTRVIDRPMVVEEERINFTKENNSKEGKNESSSFSRRIGD